MDLSRPHSFLSSAVSADVLATLARTSRPLTGRAVARRAGRSQDRVRQVLEQLAQHGIVAYSEAGAAGLYALNRQHVAAPAIELLAGLRGALVERLHAELEGWGIRPLTAAMFGSAARGDGGTESDIDLLLVRPGAVDEEDVGWREQLDGLSERVQSWTGNRAGLVEIGEDDLDELVGRDPPILQDLRTDSIHLLGQRVSALLGAPG